MGLIANLITVQHLTTMKNELVEVIILVPGNHLPLVMQRSAVDEFDTMLQTLLADEDRSKRWLCFEDSEGWKKRVHPKSILGWYFRPHKPDSHTQALAIMEKMEQKMPAPDEGDDWKRGG